MTYAVGGTIQAADFNGFTGGGAGTGANVSGQLNTVLNIGNGNRGYGQTAVSNVSAGATIAATNWASLINNLNAVRKHQAGVSYTNLTVPAAGANITFISTLSTELASAYTAGTSGLAPTAGPTLNKTFTINVAANTAGSSTQTWTVTFSSVDQARYFFNGGGYVNISYSSFTNTAGNTRGTSIQTLAQTNWSSKQLYGTFSSSFSGAGGTVVTNLQTNRGYYGTPTVATEWGRINSTSYYSGDYILCNFSTNGTAGSYAANGNILTFAMTVNSAATNAFNTAINISLVMTLSTFYPATTYLTNSWGTVTLA